MCTDLGFDVVAEGVETEAQLADLRRLGCREIQGFLLGKPLRPEMVEAFLCRATVSAWLASFRRSTFHPDRRSRDGGHTPAGTRQRAHANGRARAVMTPRRARDNGHATLEAASRP